ncbi:hypothetical protein C3Y94_025765 [Rhizobium ruizarguesonis]|uniref:hypothetical protein n=1 Tax=Rhizobium ruizarguesonis TaxID=2081791 RepID=UPI001639AC4A|nr:hypothetical protein [Rhizobium ruizarguesonis]MBC2806561.1 hypothetical protein [Rhizobium ruizarguesonis]
MLGPLSALHQLNPDEHSLGLVKNFRLTAEPQYVSVTQGLNNNVVMSVNSSDGLSASMEVYEYTTRNAAYAAGLDGSNSVWDIDSRILTIRSAPAANQVVLVGDWRPLFTAGDFAFLQQGTGDVVHIGKILSAVASGADTLITLAAGYEIPVSVVFKAGDRFGRVLPIKLGEDGPEPALCAKAVGILADGMPFTILFPKIKISSGFSASFSTENFSNIPFGFKPQSCVPGDPFYDDYELASAVLMAGTGLMAPAAPPNYAVLTGRLAGGSAVLLRGKREDGSHVNLLGKTSL